VRIAQIFGVQLRDRIPPEQSCFRLFLMVVRFGNPLYDKQDMNEIWILLLCKCKCLLYIAFTLCKLASYCIGLLQVSNCAKQFMADGAY
jgi:hypothetical protein